MRIVVLSRNSALYSTSRLVLAGRARGHRVDIIDPHDLQIVVAKGKPSLCYAGRRLPRYDVVIPRIGSSMATFGLEVVRHFEEGGARVLNGADTIAAARDKVRTLGKLAGRRIRVPRTVCMRGHAGLEEALALVGGPPVVVKLQRGAQGLGTMIAESRKAVRALVDTLWAMGHEVVLQEYVSESGGRDLRALVVGGEVIAAMRRTPARGDFRSNLHRGAHGEAVKLDRRYHRCALRSTQVGQLDVAGVDMLETPDGPVVIELNASPGLEGIEVITGVDVAGAIIVHACRPSEES